MEEKKLDKSSLIGMALITILLIWMMSGKMFPDASENQTEEAQTAVAVTPSSAPEQIAAATNDTIANEQLKAALGSFAYGASLPSVVNAEDIEVDNGVLTVVFSNKGGYIKEVTVNDQKRI